MNVIDSYLDTLFAPYPDTPRMREARTELLAMMEDKQQGLMAEGLSEPQAVGQVIAEFGSLEEIADELGIGPDLAAPADAPRRPVPSPRLSLPRAEAYAEAVRRSRWMSALSVALYVLCPVPLLGIISASFPTGEDAAPLAVGGGIVALLVMVALGVVIGVVRDARLEDHEDVDEGRFTPGPDVRAFAQRLRAEHRTARLVSNAVAISLWILCAVPVLLAAFATSGTDSGGLVLASVCLTLLLVAAGLVIAAFGGWSEDVAETLVEGDAARDDSPESSPSPVVRVISAVYWPIVVAAFLAWSFLTDAWNISWVIFPVAGVLYTGLWMLNAALADPSEKSAQTASR